MRNLLIINALCGRGGVGGYRVKITLILLLAIGKGKKSSLTINELDILQKKIYVKH